MDQVPASVHRDTDPGKDWMMQLQRGDDQALRRIVHHYGPKAFAFFRRYGADAGRAEDLAQEAFLRVYRARERYEPRARFSTWLHRILHRLAMNEGSRSRWRGAVPIQGAGAGPEPLEGALPEPTDEGLADPYQFAHRQEMRERVRLAVGSLPERQRTALLLNRFEGLSYEQVGEVLGMKIPAVKSLLFRARENVRELLAPLLREETHDELS